MNKLYRDVGFPLVCGNPKCKDCKQPELEDFTCEIRLHPAELRYRVYIVENLTRLDQIPYANLVAAFALPEWADRCSQNLGRQAFVVDAVTGERFR